MKYRFPEKGHYHTVMKVEVIRPNVAPCLREMSVKQLKPMQGFRRGQTAIRNSKNKSEDMAFH